MPNWVSNNISIPTKYENKVLNKDDDVDFGILLPMPETLHIPSGSITDDAIAVALYERGKKTITEEKYQELCEKYNKSAENAKVNNIKTDIDYEKYPTLVSLGNQYLENRKMYGRTTWYEWACANWGCKWNASDTSVERDTEKGLTYINFATPWDFPKEWLTALAKEMPFFLEWEEEQGYVGCASCEEYNNVVFENYDEMSCEWNADTKEVIFHDELFQFDDRKDEIADLAKAWEMARTIKTNKSVPAYSY